MTTNDQVRALAARAVTVADRLLGHGFADVKVEVVYNGKSESAPHQKGVMLKISAAPGLTITALELLADQLDHETAELMAGSIAEA